MSALTRRFGRQLAHPRGLGGRIIGVLMRVVNRRATALTIAALDIEPGHDVLDLGCGFGDALPDLLRLAVGGRVHAVDHSDAITLVAKRHPGVICHRASFKALPLADASVDRVLAANVAYFWNDDRRVLAELRRVLRPGGRVALYVTDATGLSSVGLDRTGTHRMFTRTILLDILGPSSAIWPVNAGWGVRGWIATFGRQ